MIASLPLRTRLPRSDDLLMVMVVALVLGSWTTPAFSQPTSFVVEAPTPAVQNSGFSRLAQERLRSPMRTRTVAPLGLGAVGALAAGNLEQFALEYQNWGEPT